jgi:hypothetical protein
MVVIRSGELAAKPNATMIIVREDPFQYPLAGFVSADLATEMIENDLLPLRKSECCEKFAF